MENFMLVAIFQIVEIQNRSSKKSEWNVQFVTKDKLLKENPRRTEFSLAAHAIQNVTLRHGINQ